MVKPQYKRQLENFDKILKCITHLIYLMLQTSKTKDQRRLVVELVANLIRINPKSATTDDTLLHMCVSKLNTIRSGYFMDEEPIVGLFCSFEIHTYICFIFFVGYIP